MLIGQNSQMLHKQVNSSESTYNINAVDKYRDVRKLKNLNHAKYPLARFGVQLDVDI